MNEKQFKLTVRNGFENIIRQSQEKFQNWFYSDDGMTLQNTLTALGSIVDFGYLGGILFPYLPQLFDEFKRKRLSEQLDYIVTKLNREEINKEFIKSELGRKIFETTLKTILEEFDKEKIEAQREFLINIYTAKTVDEDTVSSYQRILLSLDPPHLRILKTIYDPEETLRKILNVVYNKEGHGAQFSSAIFQNLYEGLGLNQSLYQTALVKLRSENILVTLQPVPNRHVEMFLPSNLEKAIKIATEDIRANISEFGLNFIKYVTDLQIK